MRGPSEETKLLSGAAEEGKEETERISAIVQQANGVCNACLFRSAFDVGMQTFWRRKGVAVVTPGSVSVVYGQVFVIKLH